MIAEQEDMPCFRCSRTHSAGPSPCQYRQTFHKLENEARNGPGMSRIGLTYRRFRASVINVRTNRLPRRRGDSKSKSISLIYSQYISSHTGPQVRKGKSAPIRRAYAAVALKIKTNGPAGLYQSIRCDCNSEACVCC